MKKMSIAVSVFVLAFFFASNTHAALEGSSSSVADPQVVVSNPVPTPKPPVGNGDPLAVTQVWGLTGHQTPHIQSGATIVDEGGIVDTCPAWYGMMGCFDLSRTDYYRNQMKELGRQLRALGVTGGVFSYWINLK